MEKLIEYFKRDSAYWGDKDRLQWEVLYTRNRDSDILTRCNWEVIESKLKKLDEDEEHFDIVNASHWLFGWIEYLIVNPENKKLARYCEDTERALSDYPILDEMKFSEMEQEELYSAWNEWAEKDYVSNIEEKALEFIQEKFPDVEEIEFNWKGLDNIDFWELYQKTEPEMYCDNSGPVFHGMDDLGHITKDMIFKWAKIEYLDLLDDDGILPIEIIRNVLWVDTASGTLF